MAFRGTYEHSVDERGRVAIPARYRHLFSDGIVLVQSPEGCVEIYTTQGYDDMAQLVTTEPATHLRGRRLRRGFFSRSWDAELDRQGRILIPLPLREKADIYGSVIVLGRQECLEIWNRQRWEIEMGEVTDAYAQGMEVIEQPQSSENTYG